MANVDISWLVKTNISINTAVIQPPSFQNCMIMGVFPLASTPSSWGGLLWKNYADYASIAADFTPLITGTTLQDNRYQWLLNACNYFFAQSPTPSLVTLGQLPPPVDTMSWDYATMFNNITTQYNQWVGFTIADKLAYLPVTGTPSTMTMTVNATIAGPRALPAGWTVSGTVTPSPLYSISTPFSMTNGSYPYTGNFTVPVTSTDVLTAVPAAAMNAGAAVPGITFTSVQNPAIAVLGHASVLTVQVNVTVSSPQTIPIGWTVTMGVSPSPAYATVATTSIPSSGTYTVLLYSSDLTTAVPIGSVTAGAAVSGITFVSVGNSGAAVLGVASHLSAQVILTCPSATQLPTGWSVTCSAGPSPAYATVAPVSIPASGTYTVDLYSKDFTTSIPINNITGQSAVSGITFNTVTNAAPAVLGTPEVPGFTELITGLNSLASSYNGANEKICFMDTVDSSIAQQLQAGVHSQDLVIFYHSQNFTPLAGVTAPICSLSAATLQAYFGNIFSPGVGLKIISSLQLAVQPVDPTINSSNIDTLVGYNNNVFAAFGAGSGIGLLQYGNTSNSTTDSLRYVDQVVGALYLKVVATANIATFLLSQTNSGGLLYDDSGIQQLLLIFKQAVQSAVDQKILQPFKNSDFTYLTYAQVLATDPGAIGLRQYNFLGFNGHFLSRIQRITNTIELSL